ncbi:MAG: glycosyltransferase [Deltaproteobacteria bacterium]|nr:glycosyltransferase [Deltaproteobacteria bacterium]
MPVYNGECFLCQAIQSILNQTFTDFTFLIIDDGSQDRSSEIIASFRDQRIEYIQNGENLGQTKTLNKGLGLINTKYVVRIDQDDISAPDRLECQVRYLESNADVAIVGSWFHVINDANNILFDFCPPTSQRDIVNCFLTYNPFAHSSLCMRTEVVKAYGGYPEDYKYGQDFALLIKIARHNKIAILDKPLVSIRWHDQQTIHSISSQLQKSREMIWSTRSALKSFEYDAVHTLRGYLTILLYRTQILAIRLQLFPAFHWIMNGIKRYLLHTKRPPLKIVKPWRNMRG